MKPSSLFLGFAAASVVLLGSTSALARNNSSEYSGYPAKCIAVCPDGYKYPTCTKDGHPINYFADPCMNHQGSSSSSSSIHADEVCGPNNVRCMEGTMPMCNASGSWICVAASSSSSSSAMSCGPNPVLCTRDKMPSCVNGKWTCVHSSRSSSSRSSTSSSVSSVASIQLTSLTPTTVSLGGKVTIEGTGFAKKDNIVHIGDGIVRRVRSNDGTHLIFRVPRVAFKQCFLNRPHCKMPIMKYKPGTYPVTVQVKGSTSNALNLTVK